MNKIKVTFILETAIEYGGGTEKTVLEYGKNMDKEKFDVTIIHSNITDRERLPEDYVKKECFGCRLIKIKYPEILKNLQKNKKYGLSVQEHSILKDIFLLYNIMVRFFILNIFNRKIKKEIMNSDIVYIVSDYQAFYIFLIDLITFKRLPSIILGTHNYLPVERRRINRLENRILKRMLKSVHYTSAKIKSISHIEGFVVTSGLDVNRYKLSEKINDVPRFLFVGRLVEYKGIFELLKAWELYSKENDGELHIIGTGELENEIIKYSRKSHNIIYHGFVKDDELYDIYSTMDVLVFPTYGPKHDEYFGLVVIEALGSGLFVILSDEMRGIFDEFERAGSLIYVKVDPEEIYKSMLYAGENIQKLKENARNMRKYIEENYDWKKIAEKLGKEFERILVSDYKDSKA
ncbi:MAG: glycosyltransferase family 4 protein [Thermoplasmata archaeon]